MNEPKPLPSETKLVETPRTDEVVSMRGLGEMVPAEFARQLEHELASLADELRLAREDARRYRWLRGPELLIALNLVWNKKVPPSMGQGMAEACDAAIDAALKEPL